MLRRRVARYVFAVRLVLFLVGIILVLLSSLAAKAGSQPSLALFSLGIAAMTSGLVTALDSFFGTDLPTRIEEQLRFQRDVYDTGLHAIHTYRASDGVFDDLEKARSIDVMANTGKSFITGFGTKIAQAMAACDCTVRILIADPANDTFAHPALMEGLCPDTDIRAEISEVTATLDRDMRQLLRPQQRRRSSSRGLLEVRAYRCVPTGAIVIVNREFARHAPYLPYAHTANAPVFDIASNRGELFAQYQAAFDRVWEHATTVIRVDLATGKITNMMARP